MDLLKLKVIGWEILKVKQKDLQRGILKRMVTVRVKQKERLKD